MKKMIFILTVLSSIVLLTTQCKKEDIKTTDTGLPDAVTAQVPDSMLQILKDLGMPIYKGNKPPNVNGIYLIAPQTLKNSNISNEPFPIGYNFVNAKVKLENQNNNKQEIYVQTKESNVSITDNSLSYISGSENNFSIFTITNVYNTDSSNIQQFLYIISGKKSSDNNNIEDFHKSLLSLKTIKKTSSIDPFISVGGARVIYDRDGISETKSTFRQSQDSWTPNNINSISLLVNP